MNTPDFLRDVGELHVLYTNDGTFITMHDEVSLNAIGRAYLGYNIKSLVIPHWISLFTIESNHVLHYARTCRLYR